ncbi:transposase [Burkholderia sp. BCC0322]|uniref:transposase n=1 Tax=unclassified Burkholderia TaxID=2613784 RepID=UPI001589E360|nr:transposase [Burkholderia sp. BCC0322]
MNKRKELLTVTNQGRVRWNVLEGSMSADILIDFLRRLMKGIQSKKVFLILDNFKIRHAKLVKAWLVERIDKIRAFYQPSCSLELNRGKMPRVDLKTGIAHHNPARTNKFFICIFFALSAT